MKTAAAAFFVAFAIVRITGVSTYHIIGILAFAAFMVFAKGGLFPKRFKGQSAFLALCYTVFTLASEYGRIGGGLDSPVFIAGLMAITALGLFLLFYSVCGRLLGLLTQGVEGDGFLAGKDIRGSIDNSHGPQDCSREGDGPLAAGSGAGTRIPDIKLRAFFILLVLLRLPPLLLHSPGIMTVDSLNQYGQLIGAFPASNHHPYVHTLMIGFFLKIVRALGGAPEWGILFYTLFQIVVGALICTYGLDTMNRLGAGRLFGVVYLAFYGLVPVNSLYAITLWKDIVFSLAVMLFTAALIRILIPGFETTVLNWFLFCLSALGMCLLRSNGFIAFIITLVFLMPISREHRRELLVFGAVMAISSLIITGPVFSVLSLQRGDRVEALSIPLQMSARVYAEGRQVSTLHNEAWNLIMDTSRIPAEYQDFCSDNMKNLVRQGNQAYLSSHLLDYGRLWVSFGLAHPMSYLRGYIDATKGFYYPDIPNVVGADYSIAPNELGLRPRPLVHNRFTIKIDEILIKLPSMIPLYGYLTSPGMYFWVFLFFMVLAGCQGGLDKITVFIPNLAVFATLMLATPVNNEFRYIYSIVLCLPLYLGWCGLTGRKDDSTPASK